MSSPSVALIGTGYWGKNLLRNFHEIGALRVACDTSPDNLEAVTAAYPDIEKCTSVDEVFERRDIDAVVIATPAVTHFELVTRGLLAGKHVFVEKPLALDLDEARELVELAEERGLVLMVGHLMQYHPAFMKLMELCEDGTLGKINYICSNRLNLGKFRREENILWSFAPHDISMILRLTGEPPESVSATGGYFLHDKIADVTTTHMEFPSGVKAHIFVSWLHPFKEQKLVVVAEKCMAVLDDTLPWDTKLVLYPHEIVWKEQMPVPERSQGKPVELTEAEPLKEECRHFIDCISTGTTPRTDGREGLQVLHVLQDAQMSMDNGSNFVGAASGPSAFVHPSAVVDQGAEIGTGTKVWHFSHILSGSRIGTGCNIGQGTMIGPDVTIGNGCKVQNNVSIYKGVTLEDNVFCGPSMVFTNVFNPRAHIRRMDEARPTLVKKGATLGANCTIICGNTIGRYAFVGAGAVVTRDVPDHALVTGNPARITGWMCACGEKLDRDRQCPACKKDYAGTVRVQAPA
ncbi:Gfo/Idh/MocA family oxidoreductase [Pseudodesulfovibrio portus]|uniref:Oxidoreductase n=1 Tax=Pseudodesulfovibrio portus TaxID=231439 RepID=A0ABN6RYW9_9BACT|nr:Gfo/Idh/MocA family oxidoreductase [Pseudodesulfovibrio portus]BDQ34690.1 oxidoreductase [Pseudodesulfovibrio portus]